MGAPNAKSGKRSYYPLLNGFWLLMVWVPNGFWVANDCHPPVTMCTSPLFTPIAASHARLRSLYVGFYVKKTSSRRECRLVNELVVTVAVRVSFGGLLMRIRTHNGSC